jgi:hypothetical protein
MRTNNKNYVIAKEKKIRQYVIFKQKRKNNNIICLGGPNIENYVKELRSFGFNQIISYERDIKVFVKQISELKSKNVCLKQGDIRSNLTISNYFYDLDFCSTILCVKEFLPQIHKIEEFSITFSLRRCSLKDTIKIFFKGITDPTRYSYTTYKDTAAMVTFYTLNQKNYEI